MERLHAGYGLNQDGHIISDVAFDKINNSYFPSIRESVKKLEELFPHLCHSVYVYGSVARGEAVVGKSDLDILVIFNRTLCTDELKALKKLNKVLSRKYHNLVRDVGIGCIDYDYVVDPINYYEQAFLKEMCVCVHGRDLRKRFGPYKLTSEIAKSFNGDIREVLARTIGRLEETSNEEFEAHVKSFSRKLIRTCYSMVMVRSEIWSTRLHEQAEVFIDYFPQKEPIIRTLQRWIEEPLTNREFVLEIFQREGQWIVENFEKEAGISSIK